MDQSPPARIYLEQTLALIKPDVIHIADEIEGEILKSGFLILQVSSNLEVVTCIPYRCDVYIYKIQMTWNNLAF